MSEKKFSIEPQIIRVIRAEGKSTILIQCIDKNNTLNKFDYELTEYLYIEIINNLMDGNKVAMLKSELRIGLERNLTK